MHSVPLKDLPGVIFAVTSQVKSGFQSQISGQPSPSHVSNVESGVASQPAVCRSVWTEASVWGPTPATAPPGGKACCARSVSTPTKYTASRLIYMTVYSRSYCVVLHMVCFCVISQLSVGRSVFTAVDVSDRTSAPAGADTRVHFAPGG